jgi:Fic family protein
MGEYQDREWKTPFADGGRPRRQARGGIYPVYLPDLLGSRAFAFSSDTAADIADAERAIERLDAEARTLVDTEALARLLLRAEAVASSHIEGLTISAQRLLRTDAARREGAAVTDATATEVLANVDAMAYALADPTHDITIERLLEIHRRLLEPTRLSEAAGKVRDVQNWIGGTTFNPFGAAFVPPPPERLDGLLADLCRFCNDDALPATAQAAIAHAQLETLHPFVNGNGRTGRALIYLVLRRRGLAMHAIPPISLILAMRAGDYVAALQGTRFVGPPNSALAMHAMDDWVALFASACTRAVSDARSFERRVDEIVTGWRERLATVRSDSSALRLVRMLPKMPIVSVRGVEAELGVTYAAANAAVAALVDAGILANARAGRRNRVFEAREIIDAFTDLERRTASPVADTRIAPPERSVPARPQR